MAPRAPRVVYWNNQAPPYFVRRMNALQRRGNIGIEAWFSELRTSDRDWSVERNNWDFPCRVLPRGPRRAAAAVALLRNLQPDLFVSLYEDYAFAAAVFAAKGLGIPTVIHAMRTFPARRRRSVIREAAKHGLFRLADAVQVSGPDSASYATSYGAVSSKVFPIREEVDLHFWRLGPAERQEARRSLRDANELTGCVFLYVGRMWRGKGLDVLLEAYRALRRRSQECSLVLVGSGEEEERLRDSAQAIGGIHFPGYAEGAALRAWYAAADVFVFPTLGDAYGHVIQEAMAIGLPVISTSAAGDIADRVVDGHTGMLVPPADPDALADCMQTLAIDADLRSRLASAGCQRVQAWSTDQWVDRFEEMAFAVSKFRA